METEILRPGLTMSDDFDGWISDPRQDGGIIVEGLAQERVGFRLRLTYFQISALFDYAHSCLTEQEKKVGSKKSNSRDKRKQEIWKAIRLIGWVETSDRLSKEEDKEILEELREKYVEERKQRLDEQLSKAGVKL